MGISNEELSALYNSTDNSISKNIIFGKIQNRLLEDTNKMCYAFARNFSMPLREQLIEDYMQFANISLLKAINSFCEYRNCNLCVNCNENKIFSIKKKDCDIKKLLLDYPDLYKYFFNYKKMKCLSPIKNSASLKTHYITILKRDLSQEFKRNAALSSNEICNTHLVTNLMNRKTFLGEKQMENAIDILLLHEQLFKCIEKINFKKDVHRDIFLSSFGFLNNGTSIINAELSRKYNYTKTAISKIIKKYSQELKDLIKKTYSQKKLITFLEEFEQQSV